MRISQGYAEMLCWVLIFHSKSNWSILSFQPQCTFTWFDGYQSLLPFRCRTEIERSLSLAHLLCLEMLWVTSIRTIYACISRQGWPAQWYSNVELERVEFTIYYTSVLRRNSLPTRLRRTSSHASQQAVKQPTVSRQWYRMLVADTVSFLYVDGVECIAHTASPLVDTSHKLYNNTTWY